MKFIILVFFISIGLVWASDDLNSSAEDDPSYIDIAHDAITVKVHEWGVSIDSAILGVYNFFGEEPVFPDQNSSILLDQNRTDNNISLMTGLQIDDVNMTDKNITEKTLPLNENNQSLSKQLTVKEKPVTEREIVDEFFLTRRLLEERDKSYVRVSYIQKYNSLEEEQNDLTIRARLGLGRSKKRLKLFIEDLKDDNANNIGRSGEENSPSIGVETFAKERFGIKPRYSIGFRGIDPFARARFSYETDFGRWHLEPVQTFLYSLEDEFSEITELYLDTQTGKSTLLRFVVDRGTKSHVKGMHYDGFVQYFWTPKKHRALSFNIGFNGSTKYDNVIIEGDPPVVREENGIYNFLFLMRWRENFWKEWLFYEIGPGVNWHERHDFRPNYNIYFRIDMFFGHV